MYQLSQTKKLILQLFTTQQKRFNLLHYCLLKLIYCIKLKHKNDCSILLFTRNNFFINNPPT